MICGLSFTFFQSAGGFNVTNTFHIKLYVIEYLRGRMWTPPIDLIRLKGAIKLCNTDEYCLPRLLVTAIVVQRKHLKKVTTRPLQIDWTVISDYRCQPQKTIAIRSSNLTGVVVLEEGCGIDEIRSSQNHLAH